MAQKLHGYQLAKDADYVDEMINVMERHKLIKGNTKINKWGFTEDFFEFMGFNGKAQNYYHDLPSKMMRRLTTDQANYFTPLDNFYGKGSGSDSVYDFGRVPVSHLMKLCDQRVGIVNRVCDGTASDVFRNRFDFVDYDNHEKVIEKPEIFRYMKDSLLWDKSEDMLKFDGQAGLGHIVGYYKGQKGVKGMNKSAPPSRPESWQSFSPYFMTPINLYDEFTKLDYDKRRWKFRGGIIKSSVIHESRVYSLELRRFEGGLRGLALAELAWTPCMCYLNTMYYVLKGLSRLGTIIASIHSEKEYPTSVEVQKYLDLWELMSANSLYVLGKNATFNLQNTAGKIGEGIKSYLEFLIEDMSAAWIVPKNQLLGRSEGGGLEGAGALVSKEDYLSSNISVKQMKITNDMMYIFKVMCGFPDLDAVTLRWNIDMHKTEEQRQKETMNRETIKQMEIMTKQAKLNHSLFTKQIKLQKEMSDIQLKMIKENPEQFMEESREDEERTEEMGKENRELSPKEKQKKTTKTDFITRNLQWKYDMLSREYVRNYKLLKMLNRSKANA